MIKQPVTIVVDGAIELAPDRIQELGISVVPRMASVGGKKMELNAGQTAASLAQLWARPRRTGLLVPPVSAFKQAYAEALDKGGQVISVHLPAALDAAAARARQARNLLSPAHIRVVELPLPGLGLARMAEAIAQAATGGWDWQELPYVLNGMLQRSGSFLIMPGTAISASPAEVNRPGGFSRRKHWLVDAMGTDAPFQLHEGMTRPRDWVEVLRERIEQQARRIDPSLAVELRQAGYDELGRELQAALVRVGLDCQVLGTWSPMLRTLWGGRVFEICLFTRRENLPGIFGEWHAMLDRARAYSWPPNKRAHLSEYEVHLT